MAKPKTLKLVIKGEVIEQEKVYQLPDGEIVTIQELRKIVVPSKKNQQQLSINKKTLKPFTRPSAQHERWYEEHIKIFQKFANDSIIKHGVSLPISRCKAKILYYFPDSKDRDLTNKTETLCDIMVDAGIILDDRFKVLKPLYLDGWVNRAKPRTEIYLTIITGDMPEYHWDLTPPEYQVQLRAKKNLKRRIKRLLKKSTAE